MPRQPKPTIKASQIVAKRPSVVATVKKRVAAERRRERLDSVLTVIERVGLVAALIVTVWFELAVILVKG